MPRRDTALARVLVVDDELPMAEMLADSLVDAGYAAIAVASSEQALSRLKQDRVDALVTDLRMPRIDGLELLSLARRSMPDLPVIVMTAYGAIDSAIESIRHGAYHYLTKPFKLEELVLFLGRALDEARVRREARALKSTLGERFSRSGIVGASPPMRHALDTLERVADTDVPVLLVGARGTGKTFVARAIHANGRRASARFVTLNCALPEPVLVGELFGRTRGVFASATADRMSAFADADGGTLFLDDVAEMSPSLQAELLELLESGHAAAGSARRQRAVDVRIVAATSCDLDERVRRGAFRDGLRRHLDGVAIELPLLRRRCEDIPILVERFIRAAKERHPASPVEQVGLDALARLVDYPWPGNVRELEDVVEQLVVLGNVREIRVADLPSSIRDMKPESGLTFRGSVIPVRELQRSYAAWALEQLGGHRSRTAERLGVDPTTLTSWLGESDGPADD